jgi:hydroxymethylpyrimidine pyrophosphatase-like HAD family hydrolase
MLFSIVSGLIEDLGLSCFPAACLHGALIYDSNGNIVKSTHLDPQFVLGVNALMKKHNKSTFLYVADWVAMTSLEQGGTDWEAVSRGFDPMVKDEREGDFLQRVMSGEEKIGKIFLPMDEEVVPGKFTMISATLLLLTHSSFRY